jgi:hypothetical protein
MWTLSKGAHEAAMDMRAVPGVGAEIVLSVDGELRRTRLLSRTSRPNHPARLPTREQRSRRRDGRENCRGRGEEGHPMILALQEVRNAAEIAVDWPSIV